MSSVGCDLGKELAAVASAGPVRACCQDDIRSWDKKGSPTRARTRRLCVQFAFWVVMEGCLMIVGIDDLVDCVEFSLAEETSRRFARTTSRERILKKASGRGFWGSIA